MDLNKSDITLFLIIIAIFITSSFFLFFGSKEAGTKALVHKNGEVILEIDLTKEEATYELEGELGKIIVSAGNGKIKVLEETSPYNLCSKQGYISKTYETIICLPNKVSIEIVADIEDIIDAVIR